jgi:hypothetical protein
MTEVKINGGLIVLFSYKTPVACLWENGQGGRTAMVTTYKWSNTTTRHINQWLKNTTLSEPIVKQPQEYFDKLMEVK